MKKSHRIALVLTTVLFVSSVLSVVLVLSLTPPADGQNGVTGQSERGTADTAPPAGEGADLSSLSWPIFRGDRGLTGEASGSLGDELDLIWNFQSGDAVRSSPVIGGGRVYFGSMDGIVYALDLENGSIVWEYNAESGFESPALFVGGSLVIGALDGILYCLDAENGSLRWMYDLAAQLSGSANWVPGRSISAANGREGGVPGASDSIEILIGSYDGSLYSFDLSSGSMLWNYATENFINGAPSLFYRENNAGDTESLAVFGSCDARVHAVSILDRAGTISVETGSYIAGSAAIRDGLAYLGNYGGRALCVDVEDGRVVWEFQTEDPFFSSPAVDEERFVIGSRDGRVCCLDRMSGELLWYFQTGGAVDSSPVICGDRVIAGSMDGRLYMLGLSKGDEIWSYEIGEGMIGSPAVAGGYVFIGSEDGRIYAFGSVP